MTAAERARYDHALAWIKSADRISLVVDDEVERPIHVTVIVSGPPRNTPEPDGYRMEAGRTVPTDR